MVVLEYPIFADVQRDFDMAKMKKLAEMAKMEPKREQEIRPLPSSFRYPKYHTPKSRLG
jgi:hypothetical protein